MTSRLRSADLWRGDIILTSMKAKSGHIVENTAINVMTASVYSHAMLYVGSGGIMEFRNKISRKSLRDGLTENGKHEPSVAHVFRHKKSNGASRERIVEQAQKNLESFKSVSMDYVIRVWTGLQEIGVKADRDEIRGMMVCSTFVSSTYHNAGVPLRAGNPHNMTPGDISLCADEGRLKSIGGARDMHAVWWSFMRRSYQGFVLPKATLDMVGVVCPSEYGK